MGTLATVPEPPALSLWDFAVSIYSQEGVEEACLALQNRLGADVNMMMFCLWLAACGAESSDFARILGSALKLSRDWQRTLVEPLRSCRQKLKEFAGTTAAFPMDNAALLALRDHVKKCELEAERLQILALANLVENNPMTASALPAVDQRREASNNLEVYFSATGVTLDPLGQSHVMRLLAATFGA